MQRAVNEETLALQRAMERATRERTAAEIEMRATEREVAAERAAETETRARERARRARRLAERDRRSQLQGRSTARRSRNLDTSSDLIDPGSDDADIPL